MMMMTGKSDSKVKAMSFMGVVLLCCFLGFGFESVEGQVHHVVGDDRGWDSASDVASWAVGRVFRVGDFLWFTYSGALDNIVELATKEELESCDLTNPIRMYTDGLDKLPLEKEGSRYFASGNHESCKKGLKLPINVVPKWVMPETEIKQLPTSEKASLAATPTSPPSGSSKIRGPMTVLFGIMILCNAFVL
ncbi:hypothetical protein Droror1_Dr00016266 [Drosera rotundifolia]